MADMTVKPASRATSSKVQRTSKAAGKTAARGASASSGSGSGTDKVELSSIAGVLAGGAAETPPVDSARIEAIKQAIREGRFVVNPEAIADKLIASVRDLVGKKEP
jgi:negative regulator of flagellin synthesis FlgM